MNFVFDIDGTLCFDGKTIDISIIEALNELSKCGHEIIFASARPIRDLVPILPTHFKKGKLVGGNGCFVSEMEKITTNYFSPDLIKVLHDIIERYKLTYLADGEWDYSYTGSTNHPIYKNINHSCAKNQLFTELQKICKLVLFHPSEAVLEELKSLPVSITHYKNENAIDISPIGVNKVYGLERLEINDFIAFGNDSNDQCMFEKASYSVCVGDSEVHKYASVKIKKEEVSKTIIKLKDRGF